MNTVNRDEIYMLERHLYLELAALKKKVKQLKRMNLGDPADIQVDKKRISSQIVQIQEICLTLPIFRKILLSFSSFKDKISLSASQSTSLSCIEKLMHSNLQVLPQKENEPLSE